jgi:hypothetical protein
MIFLCLEKSFFARRDCEWFWKNNKKKKEKNNKKRWESVEFIQFCS